MRTETRRLVAEGVGFQFAGDPRYITIEGNPTRLQACEFSERFDRFDRVTYAITPLVQSYVYGASVSGSMRRILFVEPKLLGCVPSGNLPTSSFIGPSPIPAGMGRRAPY